MDQQDETMNYFREHAQEWKRKAGDGDVNVIAQRNSFVLRAVRHHDGSMLDVGCGTGDLVCAMAQKGMNAVGVDFSQEMINIARETASRLHLSNARFECCSIFDYHIQNHFDVLSANGFIEYISYAELEKFLDIAFHGLKTRGSLILGSRNRLFNIFSLNSFTEQELRENSFTALVAEAIAVARASSVTELTGLKTIAFQRKDIIHEGTGIPVATRFQYTPIQLINLLCEKGFETVEVFPIHIHAFPPLCKDKYPTIHASISNALHHYAEGNMSLIPQSSSFMIHALKK